MTGGATARGVVWRKAAILAGLAVVLGWLTVPGALRFGADPVLRDLDTARIVTLRGEPASLATLAAGRPMVVNLWATWCPPCRREMALLAAAQRRGRTIGFAFVNQGENPLILQRYLDDEGLAIDNVLLDPARALGTTAGSTALPITLFYDARGNRVETHLGELSAPLLDAALKRIVVGAGSPSPSTRAAPNR